MDSTSQVPDRVNVVVIGSGFGGAMTSLPIAAAFKARNQGERLRILERGTWWSTPVGTVADSETLAPDHLRANQQPVQVWPAVNHFRGVLDIFLRCVRRPKNEDGLYDFTTFGTRGFLGFGGRSDGVGILRACGVGGGSLVYSNVTIRPPEFIFGDPHWVAWTDAASPSTPASERDRDFKLAKKAIGTGVLSAIGAGDPAYQGLHQIVTRSAGLRPLPVGTPATPDPKEAGRTTIRVPTAAVDPAGHWVDRARVFQQSVSDLTEDYGTVDSSIADLRVGAEFETPKAHNYCERQGRCNVGCLPGARYTLNKQFMGAIFGPPPLPPPGTNQAPPAPKPSKGKLNEFLSIEALAEVDVIVPLASGGYEVRYVVRDEKRPSRTTRKSVTADRVILAAGCVGTTEILLRSKAAGHLKGLSDALGSRFSTNGDYLAFLEGTAKNINLVRGPVTTSYAHFDAPSAGAKGGTDAARFHTIEDQGVPPALASLTGASLPFIKRLERLPQRPPFAALISTLFLAVRWGLSRLVGLVKAIRNLPRRRTEYFAPVEEQVSKIMCIAAMGREASVGRFRLGGAGETALRVKRDDGKQFFEDPIYDDIRASLRRFAGRLLPEGSDLDDEKNKFLNPFLTKSADALRTKAIGLSHALGGCPMGADATSGAVDSMGRVFNSSKGAQGRYAGLYVADASMIPTALGVNPSLTISALALRVARGIVTEVNGAPPAW